MLKIAVVSRQKYEILWLFRGQNVTFRGSFVVKIANIEVFRGKNCKETACTPISKLFGPSIILSVHQESLYFFVCLELKRDSPFN